MRQCEVCIHFAVCSRLGGVGNERCNEFILDKGVDYVKLPGRIGQTLFYIDRNTGKIETDTIVYFNITKSGVKAILKRHNVRFWDYYTWGINVFTEYDEAEAAKANITKFKVR